jgi:hypothetical protein
MPILAYFSHSYRADDRAVNTSFWELFHREGFFFTVDPQSKLFSIPYLESMMSLSNCFVAVIPRRAGSPAGCSPYILFEYGLAIQSQLPGIVFVEQGLSGASFPRGLERTRIETIVFNRRRLKDYEDVFSTAIRSLADKVRGYRNPDVGLRQPAGLIVGARPETETVYTPEVIERLTIELEKYDRELRIVKLEFDTAFELCLELERYDFLIMEVRESLQVPWLAGYVLGRAVPSIKLCHLSPGEEPGSVTLPSIVAKHKPEDTTEEPVSYWRDLNELLRCVTTHVGKFNTERIELRELADGMRYFSRAGRREAKVFVSNASVSNALAHKLIAQLRLESVDFFHYQVKDAIPIGENWLAELERQIGQATILVALLTEEFLRSTWCLYELQAAQKRAAESSMRIHVYMLEPGLMQSLALFGLANIQVRDVNGRDQDEIAAEIVADIDRELQKPQSAPDRARAVESVGAPTLAAPANPAALAPGASLILDDTERRELVRILTARLVPEDASRPAWVKGLLMHAMSYAQLAGEDYSGSAETVAIAVVSRTEALGTLPNRKLALFCLVDALRKPGRVSHDAQPFLTELADRLSRLPVTP